MSYSPFPCIVYRRLRENERRASHFADLQQDEAECSLGPMGYEVVGRFGDSEFAPPSHGFLEPRPALQRAVDAAIDHAEHHGSCALIVLRSDGIGSGDPFLPDLSMTEKYPAIDIRLCQFSLRGHAHTIRLRDAHKRFDAFADAERQRLRGECVDLVGAASSGEILLRNNTPKQLVRAYYANFSEHPVEVLWTSYSRPFAATDQWLRRVDKQQLRIPARKATYLESFIQGDPQATAVWWRFHIGTKRLCKFGDILVTPAELSKRSLKLAWTPYEPESLGRDDFGWENAPRLETHRLSFRNWRTDDQYNFAAICRMSGVMQFSSSEPSETDLHEEAAHYAALGLCGQTLWVVERKSDQQMIGVCGLLQIEDGCSPVAGSWEIVWRLRPDATGQGYAVEAGQAVLHAAFEEWQFRRIVARFHRSDGAGRRLAERMGMRENSTLRQSTEGGGSPNVVYELDERAFWELGRTPPWLELDGL